MRTCLKMFIALFIIVALGVQQSTGAHLLTNYLPASMQALAYYIDQLQYEPLSTTTVEPPFSVLLDELSSINTASVTPPSSSSASSSSNTTPRTTTRRPGSSTSGWWQPPSWWETGDRTTTTTQRPLQPTPPHKPGLYAPIDAGNKSQKKLLEGYELFSEIGDDTEFDRLPLSLINDILTEVHHDDFTNDVESLDNFLRLYDDNYGRAAFDSESAMDRWSSTSTAGKKRVPPTKPYVDFLLVYDLLKRDAKASNLSKYEGYSEELLQDLYELSQMSAQHQLYMLFTRMLERHDIQRSDVVARIQAIVKDLANPNSPTSKALQYIPTLQFLP